MWTTVMFTCQIGSKIMMYVICYTVSKWLFENPASVTHKMRHCLLLGVLFYDCMMFSACSV